MWNQRWRTFLAAVFLTSLPALLVELTLTRIFSVVFYYHFAFLAISVAMFGLGAGGLLGYGLRRNLARRLGWIACGNALAVVAALAYLVRYAGRPGGEKLAAVYALSALPFVLTGLALSVAIAETIDRVGTVYFCDLAGAAAGCLLLVPLLEWLGAPGTMLVAAAFAAASAVAWFRTAGRRVETAVALALTLVLAAVAVAEPSRAWFEIRWAKQMEITGETFVRWNSQSRVGVTPLGWGGWNIEIDRDAATTIIPLDLDHPDPGTVSQLSQGALALAPRLRAGGKTLIIGPGGGIDMLRALLAGARDLSVVEINPIIAGSVMRGAFLRNSGGLYRRPGVRVFVEDGRSFARRSREKYKLIQATLVDTWAATAAGAFALSENLLYTTEAFEDYLRRLDDDGVIAFSRWGFSPPRESLRIVSLAIAALQRQGAAEPWRHVVVAQDGGPGTQMTLMDTVLISRSPFSAADLARISELAAGQTRVLYRPGDSAESSEFARLLLTPDRESFYRQYPIDVRPVSDDRPFFFYNAQLRDAAAYLRLARARDIDVKINEALPLLARLVAISLAAVAVILLLPPLVLRLRGGGRPGLFPLYFAAIGLGFILIEVALIQKLILFLGHPTYALTVVVFTLLVSSGLGSAWSERAAAAGDRRLAAILVATAALAVVIAALAAPVRDACILWPLPARAMAAAALVAPLGFLMGVAFPRGLKRLEAAAPGWVRWAWALNAAASVLGSVLAIALALTVGLTATLHTGAALYLCAALTLLARRRQAAPTPAAC